MRSTSITYRIAVFFRAYVRPGSSVLAAVSGGSDSTALLRLLCEHRETLSIGRLGVAHVNHRLRGRESDGDERFVASLAKRLGLPFFGKKLSGGSLDDKGMEEWARNGRYRFFAGIAQKESFDCIATGHTADDQAETLLHRLLRGCGLRGLRGILAQREDGVIRPLLGIRRTELCDWLKTSDQPYRTDSSNASRAYLRNRIRHGLLPWIVRHEPGAIAALGGIARTAQEVYARMEPAVNGWIDRFTVHSEGRFAIKKEGLLDGLHAPEALRSLFERYGIDADAVHLDAIMSHRSRTAGTFLLPGGDWRYFPGRAVIEFCKGDEPAVPFRVTLSTPGSTVCKERHEKFVARSIKPTTTGLPTDNRTVVLDRDVCGPVLTYRSIRPGDRFTPLGGDWNVTVDRFLSSQKMSRRARSRCGVIEGKKGLIVWIPGLRISRHARMTGATRRALEISYQSCPPEGII
jgi:tRNA(Ile)-lysidine synthase